MDTKTSRRALLGAIAVAPVALTAAPAVAASGNPLDPVWPKLVTDFHAKHAAWMATIDEQEAAESAFCDACTTLPSEPVQPGSSTAGDILDRTLRELRDASDTPDHKAAWAEYQRNHAAWKVQRDALHEQIVGPAKVAYERTFAIRFAALEALTSHRVNNFHHLAQKIEIIAKHSGDDDVSGEYVADILADVRLLALHTDGLSAPGSASTEA